MTILSAVSGLLFLGVCAVIGVQLLWLARRTHAAPEFCFGAALCLMVLLGTPLAILGSVPDLLAPALASAASAVSMVFVEAGVFFLFAFTWKVFRATTPWARRIVLIAGCLLTVQVIGNASAGLATRSPAAYLDATRTWSMLHHVLLAMAFGWSAVEAWLCHRALHRRLALGLADPVVVDRIALWVRMGVASTLMNAVNTACLFVGIHIMTHPVPQLSTAVLGMIAAVYLFLGFLPPDWYLQRVKQRALPA